MRESPLKLTAALVMLVASRSPAANTEYGRHYEIGGIRLAAGFMPDRAKVMLGEPVFLTFAVRNASAATFKFAVGGDYRGVVRHTRFSVVATDANGSKVKDPHPEGDWGGFGGTRSVEPQGLYTERLFLPHWCAFATAGSYHVTCKRTLNLSAAREIRHVDERKSLNLSVETTFELEVLPFDQKRMREIITDLGREIQRGDAQAVSEATLSLSVIDHESVVPHLAAAIRQVDSRLRAYRAEGRCDTDSSDVRRALLDALFRTNLYAVQGLSRFHSQEAIAALIKTLQHKDDALRSRAAYALGKLKASASLQPLIESLRDSDPWVRRAVADALGDLGDARSTEALRDLLEEGHMPARLAVVQALVKLGEPLCEEWIAPIIRSKGASAWQNAVCLARRQMGERAASALVRCLEFDNPAANNYYNYTLVWQIGSCGGPTLRYHHDHDGRSTPEQIEANKKVLREMQRWLVERER